MSHLAGNITFVNAFVFTFQHGSLCNQRINMGGIPF